MKLFQTAFLAALLFPHCSLQAADTTLPQQATTAMKRAANFYRQQVASHGGYVYVYSLDLRRRWGEGEATKDQIWVQPPGTPTVGLAFLRAYEATGDSEYLDAATAAAEALVYGQLKSGGWANCIDFDPRGARSANYRNGRGRGKNNSSLDDGQTQSAIRLLVAVDKAHEFQHEAIHEAAEVALDALLAAQFPNGAFPQVWTGPVEPQPILKASYPEYDWRTEGRIKEYWNLYTLNDNVCGNVAQALVDAHRVYGDQRYLNALRKLGDFLILAQMPEPQPAWAQQYNYQMKPVWARKFEPPAIAGDESQEAIETLLLITEATGDPKYVKPILRALTYLGRSLLPDGRLARYYELKSNRPLYMTQQYELTFDDSDAPDHYGWKTESQLPRLSDGFRILRVYEAMQGIDRPKPRWGGKAPVTSDKVEQIIADLDDHGRWVSISDGQKLMGQTKLPAGTEYLSSQRFSQNLSTLSEYLEGVKKNAPVR